MKPRVFIQVAVRFYSLPCPNECFWFGILRYLILSTYNSRQLYLGHNFSYMQRLILAILLQIAVSVQTIISNVAVIRRCLSNKLKKITSLGI